MAFNDYSQENLTPETPPCQYWVEEPPRCSNWNANTTLCTFEGDTGLKAQYYPYCNLLGTQRLCNEYEVDPDTPVSMCILPDPSRHICNKETGQKWVTRTIEGETTTWSFDDITGYNEGLCNSDTAEGGTDLTCAGYNPSHMAFGQIAPRENETLENVIEEADADTTSSGYCVFGGYRLPLEHVILNRRANLSSCSWWAGDPAEFTTGKNTDFESLCTYDPFETVEAYATGSGTFGFKCNGASSECPQYTGVCWQYCIDPKLDPGDKVLAEQIQELRYYSRRTKWKLEQFQEMFPENGDIYAWSGKWQRITEVIDNKAKVEYRIPVTKVYMDSFDTFEIKYLDTVVTAGIPVAGGPPTYPSLIREIEDIALEPLILNVFDYDSRFGVHFFESTQLFDDPAWWFYGYAPYPTSNTFLINIEDPEVKDILPVDDLKFYDSMYDIKQEKGTGFDEWHTNLDNALTALQSLAPEKLRLDTNGANNSAFITDVPTYIGQNTVVVFNKGAGEWTYDKAIFERNFVGALINQTGFTVLGDGLRTVYCPDYAADFGFSGQQTYAGLPDHEQPGYKMGNYEFVFSPMSQSSFTTELSYLYNDYSFQEIPKVAPESLEIAVDRYTGQRLVIEDEEPESEWQAYYYTGYALYYKELADVTVKNGFSGNITVLDSGHLIVTIDNLEINNAVYPWSYTDVSIKMNYPENDDGDPDPDGIFLTALQEVEHSSSGSLLPNQIMLYPEELGHYGGFCSNDAFVHFDKIYIFQKRSFAEVPDDPDYSVIAEHYNQRVYTNEILTSELIHGIGTKYKLHLPKSTLIMSAVFKGRTGREIGQTKNRMVSWVKQPMCPDVEIKYVWKNDYTVFENIPKCYCHGEWYPKKSEFVWTNVNNVASNTESRTPYCGDHDLVSYTTQFSLWNGNPQVGPMWYPYNKCKGYQSYEKITGGVETAMEIMSEFLVKSEGLYIHGQHDLRMLGPDVHNGWEDGMCAQPHWCSCGLPTWNKRQDRPENNTFSGYAYVRSGVSRFQLGVWEAMNEETPRFGNSSRPAMRSYRSMDKIQFYYNSRAGYPRTRQWLPAPMYFTDLNITKTAPDEATAHYSSGYGNVIEGLGLMTFDSIDGINIFEEIDYENRFRFEQVFRTNSFSTNRTPIAYPDFVGSYNREGMPWYEYLPYPENYNHTIHWAWREPWQELKRRANFTLKEAVDGINANEFIVGPYIDREVGYDNLTGYFFPFILLHPPYVYDYALEEIRIVCDEGPHFFKFKAPIKDEYTGEYTSLAAVQLDDGPYRYFSVSDGDWQSPETEEEYSFEDPYLNIPKGYIYDETDESPWNEIVNLYTEDADWETDEDRTYEVETGTDDYDNIIKEERYFNRGLHVYLIAAAFKYLPAKLHLIEPAAYNAWVYPDTFQKDAATGTISGVGTSDLAITYEFDNKLKTVLRIDITCQFGIEVPDLPEREENESKEDYDERIGGADTRTILYNWPAFDVYYRYVDIPVSSQEELDDAPWVLVHSEGTMLLAGTDSQQAADRTESYIFNPSGHYLGNGTHSVAVVFRSTPDDTEQDAAGVSNVDVSKYKSIVSISNIDLYEHIYENATEIIETYERKFYVSHGWLTDDNLPPQGGADTDGWLGYVSGELSTVWQRDHRLGVLDVNNQGVPNTEGEMTTMNKCRGRFLFDTVRELTPVIGTIWEKERKQTQMYNTAVSKTQDYCWFRNIKLPVIDDYYLNERYIYRNIPISTGSMINTVGSMELTNLIPQDKYSPGGHLYVPLWTHPTHCGNQTFYYGYIAVSADSSADLTKYSADTNSMTQYMLGPHTLKGLGTLAVDPRLHEDAVEEGAWQQNYLYTINEVTRYAAGSYYLDLRLSMMSYLIHYVYPRYFNRDTGDRIFDDEITERVLGPNLRSFRYFPNTTVGWYDGWDRELIRFNLYGGVKGRYWGPEFGGVEDPYPELVFDTNPEEGITGIPWF